MCAMMMVVVVKASESLTLLRSTIASRSAPCFLTTIMSTPAFIPSLSLSDVEQAVQVSKLLDSYQSMRFCADMDIQLIQHAYAPPTAGTTPDELKRLQHDLFEIQKRPEAWGLVIPLLNHQDQNVQFFGAHTAQVKIARDW
jgi:hypothetical protein